MSRMSQRKTASEAPREAPGLTTDEAVALLLRTVPEENREAVGHALSLLFAHFRLNDRPGNHLARATDSREHLQELARVFNWIGGMLNAAAGRAPTAEQLAKCRPRRDVRGVREALQRRFAAVIARETAHGDHDHFFPDIRIRHADLVRAAAAVDRGASSGDLAAHGPTSADSTDAVLELIQQLRKAGVPENILKALEWKHRPLRIT